LLQWGTAFARGRVAGYKEWSLEALGERRETASMRYEAIWASLPGGKRGRGVRSISAEKEGGTMFVVLGIFADARQFELGEKGKGDGFYEGGKIRNDFPND